MLLQSVAVSSLALVSQGNVEHRSSEIENFHSHDFFWGGKICHWKNLDNWFTLVQVMIKNCLVFVTQCMCPRAVFIVAK